MFWTPKTVKAPVIAVVVRWLKPGQAPGYECLRGEPALHARGIRETVKTIKLNIMK